MIAAKKGNPRAHDAETPLFHVPACIRVSEAHHWLTVIYSWPFLFKAKYQVAMGAVERPETTGGFADFDAGHRDLVAVTKYNYYANRLLTASLDHRIKVWDLKDGQWQLIDTWTAHDAEIRDVRDPEITRILAVG